MKTMNFNLDDLSIFNPFFQKRPEVSVESLKKDLQSYYLPFAQKLIELKKSKNSPDGLIIGLSAIQGAGKTTQGEIMEILLSHFGFGTVSLSIDDHYLTHEQLEELRQFDPRYIRRGVTHDIYLAVEDLKKLQNMKDGEEVKIPIYDKGADAGDGDWAGWKKIDKKPDFILYDGWMLGVRRVEDEAVFESGLPGLDTPDHIAFAKDINKKLDEYLPLWDLIEFLNVLYVPNYQISIDWRDQAEEVLRKQGKGMSHEQIVEFVHYFWRSVHPAIHIKNLASDIAHTNQVVVISDDHSIKEILTPEQVKQKYP